MMIIYVNYLNDNNMMIIDVIYMIDYNNNLINKAMSLYLLCFHLKIFNACFSETNR